MAAAPVPAEDANSSTRLLPESATKRLPSGPTNTPVGARREEALTAAEVELLKSDWPITASGAIRPDWVIGRGKCRTRLLPVSAMYTVPSRSLIAMPRGDDKDVRDGFCDERVSTLAI